MIFFNIEKELNDEFEQLTYTIQSILPNISVSTGLYEDSINIHIDNEVVYSGGILSVVGFMNGMLVTCRMK